MKEVEFSFRKKSGKSFSFIKEFRGDLLTPIGIFNALKGNRKFIFESGTKGSNFARYSYIGCGDKMAELTSLEEVNEEIKRDFDESSNPLPFKGGVIGYTSYNLIGKYEPTLKYKNEDKLGVKDCLFTVYKDYICYDHFTHKVSIVKNIEKDDCRSYEQIKREIYDLYHEICSCKMETEDFQENEHEEIEFTSNYTRKEYMEKVEKCKEYIKNGDIFQVVFSQQVTCKTNKSGVEVYRRLRENNPSSYMFYIDNGDFEIVGSSPESLVSVRDGIVTTNPIAGTRRRGRDEKEDKALEEELINDEKERAEQVMLVDLGRNDIGKISEVGSVKVEEFMNIERFSHVMHMTSKVSGKLKKGVDSIYALISTMPAGTVSGAPKIRAMEIIEELENRKRGIYAGAVGYFSYGGNMDMSIAIRTMVIKDKTAFLQAGGGIVYDSDPEKEYEESLNKMRILMEVLK